MFDAGHDAAHVDGENLVPDGEVGVLGPAPARNDAGVVDQDVEAAEGLVASVDHGPHLVLDGDVDDRGQAAHLGRHRFTALLIGVRDDDLAAMARVQSGDGGADARSRAGNDRDLSLKRLAHDRIPPLGSQREALELASEGRRMAQARRIRQSAQSGGWEGA